MNHSFCCGVVLSVLMLMISMAGAATTTTPTAMTVMSFNVRYGTADDGPDAWPNRRELFFRTIKSHDPDLLGTQEVLAFQADELQRELPDYTFVGVGRDDGKRAGEFAAIQFRTKRFELVDKGFFWLSDQPEKPGSIGWDAALTRMATWVKLRDRLDDNRELVFLNTHWDHKGIVAHVESAKLIRAKMRDLDDGGQTPIIMTGDLNCHEESDAVKLLESENERIVLLDAYREMHSQREPGEASFHAFKGTTQGSRIDFILHTGYYRPTSAQIDRVNQDGHYPSDHFPVIAVLERH
jgi:endonuclease/exonuclease/phosphatase family metal-dependent hydrolase